MDSASLASAAIERPLGLRRRPDLVEATRWHGGARWFVVKDPIALNYYYLSEEEHFILSMLDGSASLAQVQGRFEERFAPRRLPSDRLQAFLADLHRRGLVLSGAAGQGEQLHTRRAKRERLTPLQIMERILVVRLRGIDPRPFLAWLGPKLGWIFVWPAVVVWFVVVAGALVVSLTRWDDLARRLPSVEGLLAAENLVWIGVALVIVKTLHESGHALAAWRFGSDPHEMGVQFFFLLPCLYTNVSDAWLLPSKWQRMAISAGGMYVELFIAAVAAFVWWSAEPGMLAALCQSVMLVASVGTLLLNGNPLMRYDGYYLLSDLTETPNLENRSRMHLVALLVEWGLGARWQSGDQLDPRPRPALAAYAAAALGYRAIILAGVYMMIRALLAPWRLEPIGDILLIAAIVGMVVPLVAMVWTFIMHAQQRREIRWSRFALSIAVAAGLIALTLYVPLPQRVRAPALIEPRDADQVYITVAGRLVGALPAGTTVKRGDVLARLESHELERDLVRLEAERRAQLLHLEHLETAASSNPQLAAGIPAAREAVADLDLRIGQLQELIGRLTLVAPQDGIVFGPPRIPLRRSDVQLAGWTGTPLESENRGAFLETGTLLCQVAPRGSVQVFLIVEQAKIGLVAPGASVWVALPTASGGPVRGVIEEISRLDTDEMPPHLVAAGLVPSPRRDGTMAHTQPTIYQVRARLDGQISAILPGQIGRASITARPEPIVPRLARWLGSTFRFGGTGR